MSKRSVQAADNMVFQRQVSKVRIKSIRNRVKSQCSTKRSQRPGLVMLKYSTTAPVYNHNHSRRDQADGANLLPSNKDAALEECCHLPMGMEEVLPLKNSQE